MLAIIGLAMASAFGASAADFYVAPGGSDTNAGTQAEPFATLEGARDALRALKADGKLEEAVTVNIQGGVYSLGDTLVFKAEDSGTAEWPVIFQAVEGAKPTLTGGKSVTGFEPHEGDIVKADLSTLGLNGEAVRLLVFDGKRMTLARYPNQDPNDPNGGQWAYVGGERYSMYSDSPDDPEYTATHQHLDFWQRNIPKLTQQLKLRPEDLRDWAHPEHAEISIFPRFNWSHFLLEAESLDKEGSILHLKPGSYYELRPGDRYFVQNVFEELDTPGEWYYDQGSQTLYFWPPEPLDDKPVHVAVVDELIRFDGASHITLEGLTLECGTGHGVNFKDASNCRLTKCIIRNVGDQQGCGVQIEGGRENKVIGCDIYDVADHGVTIDSGELISLTPGGNLVENCYIHHVGLVRRSGSGVHLRGTLHTIRRNLIHDTPQSGIYVWGAKHTIEGNRMRHTCLESEDTGAIGGGAIDWLSWQGVVIDRNFISDTMGFGYNLAKERWESPYLTHTLYPDWASSGTRITNNILARAGVGNIHLHSGRDNVFENNIMIEGGVSQMDWNGWTTDTGFWSTRVESWIENYEQAIQHPAWQAVPTLTDPREVPLPDKRVMHGNSFTRNIIYYEDPAALLFRFNNVVEDKNTCDYNVIWSDGHPIQTGVLNVKQAIGPNLIENSGAEEGPLGAFPAGWGEREMTPDSQPVITVDDEAHEGQRSVMVDPGSLKEGETVVPMTYFPLGKEVYVPGKTYRLSAWVKGEVTSRVAMVSYSWWAATSDEVGPEWREVEFVFKLPQDPAKGHGAQKIGEDFECHLGFPAGDGKFWVDDVSLREVEPTDEWTAWKEAGYDRNSVVADPLFENAAADDYRLKPESPALEMGFEPIAMDEIGPYQDSLRASWPIAEAPGAREALAK